MSGDTGETTIESREREEFLEIYKLHVEMADRVSQRREGANRLFVTLLSVVMVLMTAILRFGSQLDSIPVEYILVVLMLTVLSLSASWYVVIRSYRQLNTEKFSILNKLEEKLPFAFYKLEWQRLGEGKDPKRYWKLTVVETCLPIVFSVLSMMVCILAFAYL